MECLRRPPGVQTLAKGPPSLQEPAAGNRRPSPRQWPDDRSRQGLPCRPVWGNNVLLMNTPHSDRRRRTMIKGSMWCIGSYFLWLVSSAVFSSSCTGPPPQHPRHALQHVLVRGATVGPQRRSWRTRCSKRWPPSTTRNHHDEALAAVVFSPWQAAGRHVGRRTAKCIGANILARRRTACSKASAATTNALVDESTREPQSSAHGHRCDHHRPCASSSRHRRERAVLSQLDVMRGRSAMMCMISLSLTVRTTRAGAPSTKRPRCGMTLPWVTVAPCTDDALLAHLGAVEHR